MTPESSRSRSRILLLALLLLLPRTAPLPAQAVGPLDPKVVDGWLRDIRSGEEALRDGKWKAARRNARQVIDAMSDRLVRGDSVKPLFASASFVEAVAESGLGDEARAAWIFGIAQILNPELTGIDLEPYGDAGRRLATWRLVPDRILEWHAAQNRDVPSSIHDFARPHAIHQVPPKYPLAQRAACAERQIVVRALVDRTGIPRFPALMTAEDPILGYTALYAVGGWRFEPAKMSGAPIAAHFHVTINFELRGTPPPHCGGSTSGS